MTVKTIVCVEYASQLVSDLKKVESCLEEIGRDCLYKIHTRKLYLQQLGE